MVAMQASSYSEWLAGHLRVYRAQLLHRQALMDRWEKKWWYRWGLLPGWPVRWLRRIGIAYGLMIVSRLESLICEGGSAVEIYRRAERSGMTLWLLTAEGGTIYPIWFSDLVFYFSFVMEFFVSIFSYFVLFSFIMAHV